MSLVSVMIPTPEVMSLVHYTPPRGLKVLRPKHVLMLQDYMRGMSRPFLAQKHGVSVQTVTNLVNDPNVKHLISGGVEHSLLDLDTLLPRAVDVLRETFDGGSRREKLVAADKVFKLKNLYRDADSGTQTAEDVMQRVLQQFQGVTINGPAVVQLGQRRD